MSDIMQQVKFKIRIGKYNFLVPVQMEEEDRRIIFRFNLSHHGATEAKDEIKMMAGARWNQEGKYWSVTNNKRNWWNIAFLMGQNPYDWYDKPLIEYTPVSRRCYRCRGRGCDRCHSGYVHHFQHQLRMIRHGITRRGCICAVDLGLGKTLAAIEIMDYAYQTEGRRNFLYVAPRSALAAVQLEFSHWGAQVIPEMSTYESLQKLIGSNHFDGVIFDEASRIKTPTAQRSQAAMIMAESLREKEEHPYVILMSGTPAPRAPIDWWHLCEVAAPGFIREGTIDKFKQRLGLVHMKENTVTQGVYPEVVTWYDDERKCKTCGQLESDMVHHEICGGDFHPYQPSTNEVDQLYKRMKGLVIVEKKELCLDIPEKRFEVIKLEPSRPVLNALDILKGKCTRTIQFLTLARELSDGFQYQFVDEGERTCPLCDGHKQVSSAIAPISDLCPYCDTPIVSTICNGCAMYVGDVLADINTSDEDRLVDCPHCLGTGIVSGQVRKTIEVDTPKIQATIDLLDQHADVGRFVIFAGFKGSIDRLKRVVLSQGWHYVKVDGTGWETSIPGLKTDVDKIRAFQDWKDRDGYERICWIAHPASGGMGLTLTASPGFLFYSNDFLFENRAQAMDRGHRPGMDLNRGCTIYDLIYLPIDQYILDNLAKKRRLQDISMGELSKYV